tara:strand:+ start:5120 stop:5398 length:279 start_codon:yes stop_codon:yes gene_type:complete
MRDRDRIVTAPEPRVEGDVGADLGHDQRYTGLPEQHAGRAKGEMNKPSAVSAAEEIVVLWNNYRDAQAEVKRLSLLNELLRDQLSIYIRGGE